MQDSATAQCSGEMGHRIRAEGERAGDVNIRVDLPEAGGDRGVHPPDTIFAKMITVLTRYRPIVFELICSRNACNFPRRRFF